MRNDSEVTRRLFLERIGMLSGVGLILHGSARAQQAPGGGVATHENEAGAEAAADFTCTDVSDLTEQQVTVREALKYVDESPIEDQRCDNCQFFVLPEEGVNCGTCQTVPGPIHPQGYCIAWVAKP